MKRWGNCSCDRADRHARKAALAGRCVGVVIGLARGAMAAESAVDMLGLSGRTGAAASRLLAAACAGSTGAAIGEALYRDAARVFPCRCSQLPAANAPSFGAGSRKARA